MFDLKYLTEFLLFPRTVYKIWDAGKAAKWLACESCALAAHLFLLQKAPSSFIFRALGNNLPRCKRWNLLQYCAFEFYARLVRTDGELSQHFFSSNKRDLLSRLFNTKWWKLQERMKWQEMD